MEKILKIRIYEWFKTDFIVWIWTWLRNLECFKTDNAITLKYHLAINIRPPSLILEKYIRKLHFQKWSVCQLLELYINLIFTKIKYLPKRSFSLLTSEICSNTLSKRKGKGAMKNTFGINYCRGKLSIVWFSKSA